MPRSLRPSDLPLEDRLEAHLRWRLRAGLTRFPLPETVPSRSPPARASQVDAVPPPSAPVASTSQPGAHRLPSSAKSRLASERVTGPDRGTGSNTLEQIRDDLGACTRCALHLRRKQIVFGVGNPAADLVFVGEGPGAQEDLQGEPFVGRAGELLTRMIEAMGLSRPEVYICNVVKCRPPGNRDPEPAEVAACEPFLKDQLLAIRPRVIVGLGRFAVQSLLGDPRARITRVRGRWAMYNGVPLMPTLHPAYLLRNPAAKRDVWEDLQAVMARLGSV